MKIKEIQAMDDKAVQAKLKDLRLELIKLNAQVHTGTNPKSPGQIKQIKKSIAQLLTVMNARRSV